MITTLGVPLAPRRLEGRATQPPPTGPLVDSPAGNSTAVGVRPFFTINATAIGTSTPRSPTAPANSAQSNRNGLPADSSRDRAVLTMPAL